MFIFPLSASPMSKPVYFSGESYNTLIPRPFATPAVNPQRTTSEILPLQANHLASAENP